MISKEEDDEVEEEEEDKVEEEEDDIFRGGSRGYSQREKWATTNLLLYEIDQNEME